MGSERPGLLGSSAWTETKGTVEWSACTLDSRVRVEQFAFDFVVGDTGALTLHDWTRVSGTAAATVWSANNNDIWALRVQGYNTVSDVRMVS